MSLVDYGIQNDRSHYHAHVAFEGKRIYLFQTRRAREIVAHPKAQYRGFSATQPGANQPTGIGLRVPADDIQGCRSLVIPQDILSEVNCRIEDAPTDKGKKAIEVFKAMFWRRLLPIVGEHLEEVTDKLRQRQGIDIVIDHRWTFQVKADFKAAERGLALQTKESNPFHLT